MENFYEELNAEPSDKWDSLKKKITEKRKEASRLELGNDASQDEAKRLRKLLKEAEETLSDPDLRKMYDRQLIDSKKNQEKQHNKQESQDRETIPEWDNAVFQEENNNWSQAFYAWRRITGAYPRNAEAWANQARSALRSNWNDEAIEAATRAVQLDSQSTWGAWAYRLWAVALERANRKQEALEKYRKSLEIEPDNDYSLGSLGELELNLGRTSWGEIGSEEEILSGLEHLKKAISLSENRVTSVITGYENVYDQEIKRLLLENNNPSDSKRIISRILQFDPTNSLAKDAIAYFDSISSFQNQYIIDGKLPVEYIPIAKRDFASIEKMSNADKFSKFRINTIIDSAEAKAGRINAANKKAVGAVFSGLLGGLFVGAITTLVACIVLDIVFVIFSLNMVASNILGIVIGIIAFIVTLGTGINDAKKDISNAKES